MKGLQTRFKDCSKMNYKDIEKSLKHSTRPMVVVFSRRVKRSRRSTILKKKVPRTHFELLKKSKRPKQKHTKTKKTPFRVHEFRGRSTLQFFTKCCKKHRIIKKNPRQICNATWSAQP